MTQHPTVQCPDCGTRYRWRPEFAGKDLHCRCGCTFTPTPPEGVEVPASARGAGPAVTPFGSVASPVQQALEAGQFEAAPPTFTDRILPTILLCAGTPVGILLLWAITGKLLLFAVCLGGLIAFELLIAVPVMLGALAWLASAFGEGFGRLQEVLFKIASVTFGPGLIADAAFAYGMTNVHNAAIDFNWPTLYVGGFGGGFAIYFILQGLPAWAMFRTHPAMIASVIACNFTLRFGLFFAAYYALRPFWP